MVDIKMLTINTSLTETEAKEFVSILLEQKCNFTNATNIEILEEFQDNWAAFDNYKEAFKDAITWGNDITEEEFKENAFVLSSGRCLVG